MLVLRWFLMILGLSLFSSAGALVAYDIYLSSQLRRLLHRRATLKDRAPRKAPKPVPLRLQRAA